jgi:hypothetical protein
VCGFDPLRRHQLFNRRFRFGPEGFSPARSGWLAGRAPAVEFSALLPAILDNLSTGQYDLIKKNWS